MKRIAPLLLAFGTLATTGCITSHLVKDKARTHLEYDLEADRMSEVPGRPGYYAFLPLTVVGDVATSPFQLVHYLCTDNSHQATATIHGIPVPLP